MIFSLSSRLYKTSEGFSSFFLSAFHKLQRTPENSIESQRYTNTCVRYATVAVFCEAFRPREISRRSIERFVKVPVHFVHLAVSIPSSDSTFLLSLYFRFSSSVQMGRFEKLVKTPAAMEAFRAKYHIPREWGCSTVLLKEY